MPLAATLSWRKEFSSSAMNGGRTCEICDPNTARYPLR